MSGASRVTPPPRAGQHGPAWGWWVDRYAHTHAAAVETIAVEDFPPRVRDRIAPDAGEAATDANVQSCAP